MFWGRIGVWEFAIIAAVVAVLISPFWRNFKRLGYPGWLSLLLLVPGVNLVVLYVAAHAARRAGRDTAEPTEVTDGTTVIEVEVPGKESSRRS